MRPGHWQGSVLRVSFSALTLLVGLWSLILRHSYSKVLFCNKWRRLAATLRGSRPGVQSTSPKTPKIQVFRGHPAPGVAQPLYSGDSTRPRHTTYVQVWSKSDQRRLRKTLHKQTDKPTDTTKIMVTWLWTKNWRRPWWSAFQSHSR